MCAMTCPAAEPHPLDRILLPVPTADAGGLSRLQLRRVATYIEENLDGDLGLVRLAAAAGLSPSHFARRFKGATGLAPHRYVMQRRLYEAKRLLAVSSLPIAQVAAATGFSSQAHLTDLFGRCVGVPPGSFRSCVLTRCSADHLSAKFPQPALDMVRI